MSMAKLYKGLTANGRLSFFGIGVNKLIYLLEINIEAMFVYLGKMVGKF